MNLRCLESAVAVAWAALGFSLGAAERPDVMAVYFPNWHVSPQLETHFGPGRSEWDFVRTSPTRFPGHRQPLVPVHGYLDGKSPQDVAKEIDLAADAGIDVFLYDYYYYGGATILQEALDEGFLKAPNRSRIKFALMWCYHEFDNEFRLKPEAKRERMYSLAKTPYEVAGMIELCIRRYFPQPNYYRKDGALYFSIYNPMLMMRLLGADGMKAALADARRRVRAAGLGEIHFNGQGGKIENTDEMKALGLDSLTDYAFGVYALKEYKERRDRGEWLYDFGTIGPQLEAFWRQKEKGPLPYYPLVPTGWDTSGRMRPDVQMPVPPRKVTDPKTQQIVHATANYPYTGIYTNATAANFSRYLTLAKRFAAEDPKRDLVQINAWNEYTEGCWLVPDNFEGDAKLRAIEKAFGKKNADHRLTLEFLPGEYWWGGEVGEGWHMPIGADRDYKADMRVKFGASGNNQAAPLMLSSKGRWIWCENAFAYRFEKGRLFVEAEEGFRVQTGRAGDSLRSAFEHCSKTFFPPKGTPELLFFEKPILNSWMEHLQNQSQERFVEFVDSFFRNGEEPGVVMVDCYWQKGLYGDWHFNEKFPEPKKMVDDLHRRGCAVMLWISPFLDGQAPDQKKLYSAGCLIPRGKRSTMDVSDPDAPGQTKTIVTGEKPPVLDPTNPRARAWFKGELERLMGDYGIDGFFFDYGDCSDFQDGRPFVPYDPKATNADLTRAIQSFGEQVPYQQLRAAWKQGGLPLMNTLRDKGMNWTEVRRCIADMIAAGQLGYPFIVADLVGGGLGGAFTRAGGKVDQEIYLRHLEVQALSPMVQFSLSPWRLLSQENQARVKKVLAVRRKFTPYIVAQAKSCGKTGLPMLRSMDFQYPGRGYELVLDQFMLGDDLLVAPVVEGGVKTRKVVIPEGRWKSDLGETVIGPTTVEVETPLERLPYFERAGAARPDVLAIYYPHWHVYPKGNEWFHPGWTEWEYVRDSPARFPGHQQPLVPVHGYLDGKNPQDVAKEIDLAADAGIDVFLYDYYYYNGETTQEEALEQGFLKAPNRSRMKFAIMWCYHDRGMAWRPDPTTAERKKLMAHDGTPEEFLGLIDLCVRRYFPSPEHYRKNGALYFSFYNPWGFIQKVGRDGARAAFAEARRRVRAAGLGEIHFNGQGGRIENTELMRDVGFDSLTDYAYGVYALKEYKARRDRGEWLYDFGAIGPQLEGMWRTKGRGPLPYYPLVPTGWDTSARMRPDVKMPVKGPGLDYPYTGIFTNATAAHFGRYLEAAKRFAAEDPKRDLIQVNAWNEYTEGCWLVPDTFEGDAKLRAVEKTFGKRVRKK